MELRPYQSKAVEAIVSQFKTHRSTLAVLATGCGKTVIFSHVSDRLLNHGRIMVLAHREELIWQAANKLRAITGHDPDIEMADYHASTLSRNPIVVSSIQTQCAGRNGGRMHRFNPDQFSLVVVDEAHHAPAKSYRRVVAHYSQNPNLRILGVTATPDRADKAALGQVFDSVAFEYSIEDAIDDGWLVPIRQQFIVCDDLDFSSIRTTAGDLNGADLAEVLEAERVMHEMVSPTIEIAGNKRTLFFAASVIQAERTAEIFNRHRADSARCVFGTTPKDQRSQIFKDFNQGRFNVLVNVGVATEGFDSPGIEVVAIGRPTKSRALYCQMVGRGTRPLEGVVDGADDRHVAIQMSGKPEALILDFVGNSGQHKLITTADILGGKYSDEVRERARKIAASSPSDMSEALREADYETKLEAQIADAARRVKLAPRAKYVAQTVNPFRHGGGAPAQKKRSNHHYFTRATEKQVKFLARYQIDASGMTIAEASRLFEQIKNNNWRRPAALAV